MRMVIPLCLLVTSAAAEPPEVRAVDMVRNGETWRISVTLAHPDTGWDHYADGWRVETVAGDVLGTRDLLHPHVSEQPFTRSVGGVAIPEGMTEVFVRARCSYDGWNAGTTRVDLPQD